MCGSKTWKQKCERVRRKFGCRAETETELCIIQAKRLGNWMPLSNLKRNISSSKYTTNFLLQMFYCRLVCPWNYNPSAFVYTWVCHAWPITELFRSGSIYQEIQVKSTWLSVSIMAKGSYTCNYSNQLLILCQVPVPGRLPKWSVLYAERLPRFSVDQNWIVMSYAAYLTSPFWNISQGVKY